MNDGINEFEDFLLMIRGIYEDSRLGYDLLSQKVLEWQSQMKEKIPAEHLDSVDLDAMPFIYARGDVVTSEELHHRAVTFGYLKARNANRGYNLRFVANTCIVMLFQSWEDHFREVIAEDLGVLKTHLRSDIMGDMRIIRNSIIHNHSVATSKIVKCANIKYFDEGDPIAFTEEQFYDLLDSVQTFIFFLRREANNDF